MCVWGHSGRGAAPHCRHPALLPGTGPACLCDVLDALHGTPLPRRGQAELHDLLTRSASRTLAILLFSTQLRLLFILSTPSSKPLETCITVTQVPEDSSGTAAHAALGRDTGRDSGRGCECLILHVKRSGITLQLAALLSNAVGPGPRADR